MDEGQKYDIGAIYKFPRKTIYAESIERAQELYFDELFRKSSALHEIERNYDIEDEEVDSGYKLEAFVDEVVDVTITLEDRDA